jgi:hypothetical protein
MDYSERIRIFRSLFKGRQAFLENPPGNFFRIMHDYSKDKKGYIVWKDLLEERLV